MSRAKSLGKERVKALKRKKMKKGCLGRFVVFCLVVGFAAAAYGDYYFYTENQDLHDRLTTVEARLDQATADQRAHNMASGKAGAGNPQPAQDDDWLKQAQGDVNKAAEAVGRLDFGTAKQDLDAAGQAIAQKPKHMTAEAQQQYDSLQKQIAGIDKQASGMEKQLAGIRDRATSLVNGL